MAAPTAVDRAQPVLAPPAQVAIFLNLAVPAGREGAVRAALADVPALERAVGFRIPENRLSVVTGIGANLWDRGWRDVQRPEFLHPFREVRGDKHVAPATPGDLFFHIRCTRFDMCFDLAQRLLERLGDAVEPVYEVHGFRSWDERDLLGFVDGTENPPFGRQAADAVLIPDDAVYAGGSYVIVQKYLHNLDTWTAESVEAQERVIGRTKLEDVELPDDVKPSNSHVALNTIYDADGTQRQIVRDNLPFGTASAGEFGTFFIGYAADPDVTETMLDNMFVGNPPGNYDRILDFSTAVTGGLFFVPPADFLEEPETYAAPPTVAPPAPSPQPADGSLGIGDLKQGVTA